MLVSRRFLHVSWETPNGLLALTEYIKSAAGKSVPLSQQFAPKASEKQDPCASPP